MIDRMRTPAPHAVAVLLDAARECYGDDSEQVRWLLKPDAVRELLRHAPSRAHGDDVNYCPECGVPDGEAHGASKRRAHCPVAEAWRALGDPRGDEDVELAHHEALCMVRRSLIDASINEGFGQMRRLYESPAATWRRLNEPGTMGTFPPLTPPSR